MKDANQLVKAFEQHFPNLCKLFEEHDITPILIGGSARDFFLNQKLSYDLDLEIHAESLTLFEEFKKAINKQFTITELNYNIFTIKIKDYELEFTLPRKEEFDGTRGHSNFKAHFFPNLPFKESFARRDLTINSIGVDLISKELIDPFDGMKDIKNRLIKPVGEDFSKDPVRFLRAIRFKTNLSFDYHHSLLELFQKEELKGLNSFHFFQELTKAYNKQAFIQDIIKYLPKSFLVVYLHFLPNDELSLDEIKLYFYLKSTNDDYLEWGNLPIKNYKRALSVYKEEGDLTNLPQAIQNNLSRIIAIDKMSRDS